VLTLILTAGIFAINTNAAGLGGRDTPPSDSLPVSGSMPAFTAFTGNIIDIMDHPNGSDTIMVVVENEDEARVNFVWTDKTYVQEGLEIVLGERITGYYDNFLPMIMIWPPQPNAFAFTKTNDEPPFVLLDRFDEKLVNYGGSLMLHIGENTEIILQDGSEFLLFGQTIEEALANRILMVTYAVTTRSIPAQTTPSQITVPPIGIVPPGLSFTPLIDSRTDYDFIRDMYPEAGTPVRVVINNETVVEVPFQFLGDGTVMIPLYLIAPELNVELGWDAETKRVLYGEDISFTIGEDAYMHKYRSAVISLGASPVIINDRTHVPLSFFSLVAGFNNAFFFEGQIEINNFERME
jgi:hypothetical protein